MNLNSRRKNEGLQDEIIISDYLRLFIRNAHWVTIAVLLSIVFGYINLRYKDQVFQSQGSIKIESDNNNLLSEVSIIKDLNPKDKVLTETYILRSKRLILNACRRLPVQTSYYSKGRVVNKELYKSSPFLVYPIQPDSLTKDKSYDFTLLNKKEYIVAFQGADNKQVFIRGSFGDTLQFDGNRVVVHFQFPDYDFKNAPTTEFSFVFNSESSLYNRINQNLDVSPADKGVSLLVVTYKDNVPDFASDFINALMSVYSEFDVEIKSQTATQTIAFMETLQQQMEKTVKGSELNMRDFKKQNNVFDLGVKGESSFKSLSDLETQKRMMELQMLALDNLDKQIQESKTGVYLPLSVNGYADPVLFELLASLNKMSIDRIALSEKVTTKHPSVLELDKQIDDIRRSVKQNIFSARKKIQIQLQYLVNEIGGIKSDMLSLPSEEQQLVNLKRDLEVNQRVYGFLLQTKLEAAISRASIVSSARIIDMAEPSYFSIAPNKRLVYLLFVIGGVLLSCLTILLFRFLNDKIYTVDEIEDISSIPVIGSVLAFPQKLQTTDSRMLAIREHRSVFGESIRSVRTNLQFLLPGKEKKIITITSTISGEGKTFTTINLAGSLTMLEKRVVIIGCDLRKPQLETTFQNPNAYGLSSYLAGTCTVEDIVHQTEIENLSLIFSGPIPPNPAELLHSERMTQLLDLLKERFDYILLDTSPVGLVADAVVLIKYSDIIVYVVKAGYSQRSFLELPNKLREEHKLNNIYLLLNSYKVDKLSHRGGYYGYGNGGNGYYAQEDEKKQGWLRLLKLRS